MPTLRAHEYARYDNVLDAIVVQWPECKCEPESYDLQTLRALYQTLSLVTSVFQLYDINSVLCLTSHSLDIIKVGPFVSKESNLISRNNSEKIGGAEIGRFINTGAGTQRPKEMSRQNRFLRSVALPEPKGN